MLGVAKGSKELGEGGGDCRYRTPLFLCPCPFFGMHLFRPFPTLFEATGQINQGVWSVRTAQCSM